jgi:uncharacterized protein with ParB-like and HNH nuclease domain
MKAGKHTVRELFFNKYVDQIIIPEIQRDYVWGKDQVAGLLATICEGYEKYLVDSKEQFAEIADFALRKDLQTFVKKRECSTNIGFIYAYENEQLPGYYFLIDGQQRLTTIYLLLLALTSEHIQNRTKFEQTYFPDRRTKLDYRVREVSSIFLNKFVTEHLKHAKVDFKELTLYYHTTYDYDTTVQNLLQNFSFIKDFVLSDKIDQGSFFDYVENFVEFQYFDTSVSEQGEELYIYMNARGEQIQDNENLKAAFLSQLTAIEIKNSFGKKWEDWQDFFWNNKGKNKNADIGFNEFLKCIAAFEQYKNRGSKFYTKKEFDSNGTNVIDVSANLTLEKIEEYMESFKYINERWKNYAATRNYSKWMVEALRIFWRIFNESSINWFADYTDDNRATERRAMVYCWSVLSFIRERLNHGLVDGEAFRLLRIYYVRYNNNDRSVNSITSEVKLQTTAGIWKESRYSDERKKFEILESSLPENRRKIEELIWEIEDHPLNLDGSGYGLVNFSHLLTPIQDVSIESLRKLIVKFNELFPSGSNSNLKLQGFLLNYGAFYVRVSPWYYSNYRFDDWKRTIRGLGSESNEHVFRVFWDEFYAYEGSLDAFIIHKNFPPIEYQNVRNLHDQLIWYAKMLEDRMWQKGCYIAFHPEYGRDVIFKSQHLMFNTKGDMRSWGHINELSTLLSKEVLISLELSTDNDE